MKKKKTFIPGSTKVLLALASLAGTVGLWNVISNQSLAAAQKANDWIDAPADLSPIPTLVQLVQVTPSKSDHAAAPSGSSNTLRNVTPQQVNPAPAQSGVVSAPAVIPNPITTTGSSK